MLGVLCLLCHRPDANGEPASWAHPREKVHYPA